VPGLSRGDHPLLFASKVHLLLTEVHNESD
jgi:hypothetical protein